MLSDCCGHSLAAFPFDPRDGRLRIMTLVLQAAGFIALLALAILWGIAFWKRPPLAWGVLIGLACAVALVIALRSVELHEIPVWLPAVPFALVALALYGFGFLAWYWGRRG